MTYDPHDCHVCGHPMTAHRSATDRRPGPCAICGCTADIDTRPQGRFVHDRVFLRAPAGTDPLTALRAAMAVFMETDDGPDATVIGRVTDGRRAIETSATEETTSE